MKILITNGRSPATLELARHLHHGGHEVFAVDTSYFNVCRFSNTVKKCFVVPIPSKGPEKYIESLKTIILREEIDFFIPVWEDILYVSKAINAFPKSCKVFCSSFDLVHELHHKFLFMELLKKQGILVPKTVLIHSQEELDRITTEGTYALKACYSRASRKVFKVDKNHHQKVAFNENNPWILQEWIEGERFCTYSVCNQGAVLAQATYPVEYTLQDKNSCIVYEAKDHPKILQWVKKLAASIHFTGHFAFDFIESPKGEIYCIECNPRITGGIHLFNLEDNLQAAFMDEVLRTITPKPGTCKQIATGMIIYGWKFSFSESILTKYLKKTFTTRDVIFCLKDIKPFLMEPFIFFTYWLTSLRRRSTIPEVFTDDFDWVG